MTIWHCNLAVSLDMKIARPDGSVEDWLVEDYTPAEGEFEAFLEGVDLILMGRDTYDAVQRMGDWPYPGKAAVVLSHRPLGETPPGVERRSGDLAAVVAEIEARGTGRVWVEGGGRLVRDLLALGKIDVLEMAVIPVVLGEGIPLFPEVTVETWFDLESVRPWVHGAFWVVYRRRAGRGPGS
jgi:dihydrofolate reductase